MNYCLSCQNGISFPFTERNVAHHLSRILYFIALVKDGKAGRNMLQYVQITHNKNLVAV